MEQNVKYLIVLAVDIVLSYKFQELIHLLLGDGQSRLFGVVNDSGKLKTERILN